MTVNFDEIPDTLVPGVSVEIDATRATSNLVLNIPHKVLVLAQMTAAGTATADVPFRVTSAAQAATKTGAGSIAAQACERALANARGVPVWCVPVADHCSAVPAEWEITVSAGPTEAGTVPLRVGARPAPVALTANMTPTEVATAIKEAVNAVAALAATADSAAGVATLIAKNGGTVMDDLDVRWDHDGDDDLPAGLALALDSNTVSGANDPDFAAAIAAMGDEWFTDLACQGAENAASVEALRAELVKRWKPPYEKGGINFLNAPAVLTDEFDLSDLLEGLDAMETNDPFTVDAVLPGCPSPPWEVGAAMAAAHAYYSQADPARPYHTIELIGILAPKRADRLDDAERDLVLKAGRATLKVDAGGRVVIERLVTTYLENSEGAADIAYRDVTSVDTPAAIRYDWHNYIYNKYIAGRYKVADDDARVNPGVPVIKPATAKAEALGRFRVWEGLGWVSDFAGFKASLIAERNGSEPTEIDWEMVPKLVSPFMRANAKISFLL